MAKDKENKLIDFDDYNDKLFTYSTSKGNLPKWNINGHWYKVDAFGYESLAEYIISMSLAKSSIDKFVKYEVIKGTYNGKACNFSKSKDFLNEGENLVTFHRLHYAIKGEHLTKTLLKYNSIEDKIKYIVDFLGEATKLNTISKYVTYCMEVDMLFLNEDRHFNNLAVIRDTNTKKYRIAPIFDNGLSLLSDMNEYNNDDIYKDIAKVKGKPFSTSLEEQCEVCEKLYGTQITFNINKDHIDRSLDDVSEFYQNEIINRVKIVCYEQMRKYQYLFRI